jgi:hypothetical protein
MPITTAIERQKYPSRLIRPSKPSNSQIAPIAGPSRQNVESFDQQGLSDG